VGVGVDLGGVEWRREAIDLGEIGKLAFGAGK
jgi:hypothetical protein